MLVPVAILIGLWFGKSEGSKEKKSWRELPIPWFIFGFLAMSAVHSLGIIRVVAGYIVVLAYMLIAMAMAGLGLNVEFKTFRKLGSKAFVAGLIGSVCLSVLGYVLVYALDLCSREKAVPEGVWGQLFLMIIVALRMSIYLENRRYKWSCADIFGKSPIYFKLR